MDNGFQAHSAFSEPGHRLRSTAATLFFSARLYHIRKGTVITSTSSPCLHCLSMSSPLHTPSRSFTPHLFDDCPVSGESKETTGRRGLGSRDGADFSVPFDLFLCQECSQPQRIQIIVRSRAWVSHVPTTTIQGST